nr:PadR family transcriptional regulator [uncultured Dysosmobacter sp.]
MAREKFQTLTEQMFYILLCLRREQCGADIMAQVSALTAGRVSVGPGTLYHLLESFLQAGYIRETRAEGRKRSYLITEAGQKALDEEYRRLQTLTADYDRLITEGGT